MVPTISEPLSSRWIVILTPVADASSYLKVIGVLQSTEGLPPVLPRIGSRATVEGRLDPETVVAVEAVSSSYRVSGVVVLIDPVVWTKVPLGTLFGITTVTVLE